MFVATGDRIVGVELLEKVSKGGIVIPDTAVGNDPSKQKCLRVKIVSIGPGLFSPELNRRVSVAQHLGVDVAPGDVVITNRYCNMLKVDGEDVRVFGPSDVIGVERG